MRASDCLICFVERKWGRISRAPRDVQVHLRAYITYAFAQDVKLASVA